MAGGFNVLLILLRTSLKGRTLPDELNGYADYARQVRYRLLPGIWQSKEMNPRMAADMAVKGGDARL